MSVLKPCDIIWFVEILCWGYCPLLAEAFNIDHVFGQIDTGDFLDEGNREETTRTRRTHNSQPSQPSVGKVPAVPPKQRPSQPPPKATAAKAKQTPPKLSEQSAHSKPSQADSKQPTPPKAAPSQQALPKPAPSKQVSLPKPAPSKQMSPPPKAPPPKAAETVASLMKKDENDNSNKDKGDARENMQNITQLLTTVTLLIHFRIKRYKTGLCCVEFEDFEVLLAINWLNNPC